jgi:tRNA-splicing ligase RtcB
MTKRGRDKGSWETPPEMVDQAWAGLVADFELICAKHPRLKNTNNRKQLGTLGTGNHFVEICLDEHDHVWIMLHSGSRGVVMPSVIILLSWHVKICKSTLLTYPIKIWHI